MAAFHPARPGTSRRRSSRAARVSPSSTTAARATWTRCPGCSWCRSVTAAPNSPRSPPGRREAGVLPAVGIRHPDRDRARRAPRALRARRPEPGVLHHRRHRGRRDRVESGQAVLQAHRQTRQAQSDFARDRLSRHHPGRLAITGLPLFKAPFEPVTPGGFRVPNTNFYRAPEPLHERRQGIRTVGRRPDRRGDRVRRARHRRRGLPGAGAERRRLHPAAPRLFRAGSRDLRRVRRAVGFRRGDLRVRPDRVDVRL